MTEPVIGAGVPFERIRRITGYLVGSLDRFNNEDMRTLDAGDYAKIQAKFLEFRLGKSGE